MKRHLVYPIHFDTRALFLDPIKPEWAEDVKKLHQENRQRIVEGIEAQFGASDLDTKVENFRELRELPFSIVSYHNRFFQDAREAFVIGSYYPAATAACALGERILNHLVIDLRSEFTRSPEYKKVYNKNSFDNWSIAIDVLSAWGVLRNETPKLFEELARVRNRLIHFSPDLYGKERDIALAALTILSNIVKAQFGFFGLEHWWAIKGTKGAQFISRDAEQDAFIRNFYLPCSPVVGPYYAIHFQNEGCAFFDRIEYPEREITDEEFVEMYNARLPEDVVLPVPSDDVRLIGVINRRGSFLPARRMDDGGWMLEESPKY
jgi:hypothetical protein